MKLFINLIYKINFKNDFYKLLNLLNYNKHLYQANMQSNN